MVRAQSLFSGYILQPACNSKAPEKNEKSERRTGLLEHWTDEHLMSYTEQKWDRSTWRKPGEDTQARPGTYLLWGDSTNHCATVLPESYFQILFFLNACQDFANHHILFPFPFYITSQRFWWHPEDIASCLRCSVSISLSLSLAEQDRSINSRVTALPHVALKVIQIR